MNKKTTILTDRPLAGSPQLCKNPELITIKAISPKIVDQLPFIDGMAMTMEAAPVPYDDLEIIGAIEDCILVVRHIETGRLSRLRSLPYIMYLMENGLDNAAANEQVKNLPQIFEA